MESSPRPGLLHTHSISSLSPSFLSSLEAAPRLINFDRQSTTNSSSSAFIGQGSAPRNYSLLSKISMDLSSLVRSHSLSRRSSVRLETDITSKLSAYSDKHSTKPDSRRPLFDMFSNSLLAEEDERPSRKSKFDNRFYNFITRSRSRSRSRNGRAPSVEKSPVPAMPKETGPHVKLRNTDKSLPPSPGAKPTTRVQSRPLSSTTTATNTTVTPGTPKPRKHPPSGLPIPSSKPAPPAEPERSRPSTPKPSATRKRLHNLFGIPLGSQKSPSHSRSRPASPRASVDVPPLPTSGHDDDPTPKPLKLLPIGRSHSPSPTRPRLKVSAGSSSTATSAATTSTAATSPSLRLPRLFSGASHHKSDSTSRPSDQLQSTSTSLEKRRDSVKLPPVQSPTSVSAPLKRAPSTNRRSIKAGLDNYTPVETSGAKPRPDPATLMPPPTITHTPATPLKSPPGTPISRFKPSHGLGGSLDTGYRYRGATMGVVDEEGRTGADVAKKWSFKGKAKDKDPEPAVRTGLTQMSNAARSRKHGSFDFERPGWGATIMQRTGSAGTSNSGWSRESATKERESALGPGLAGVGTLQRDASMKRSREREEQMRVRRKQLDGEKFREAERDKNEGAKEKTKASSSHRATPQSDHAGASTSTNGTAVTAATGKSSSMSKATGKKSLFGKRGSASGSARLVSAQHGPFAFEPPVSSASRSTGSTGAAPEVSTSWAGREREKERLREEKERQKDKKGLPRIDRAPVPVPVPPHNVGHRSGTKGRSLDLGLGLAWAPSKVREDALLPSSTFFNRTISNSSSIGRSVSASTNGRSVSSSTNGNGGLRRRGTLETDTDAERSKVGREVAEIFRNALDEKGYATFKQYVHQFDAHEIPFDGPTGIVTRVERLLTKVPNLGHENKQHLLDNFIRIILHNA